MATAQVISGFLIYGAWLAALSAIAWQVGGRTAGLIVAFAIPLLALVSLFTLERESAVLDAVRSWVLLRRARRDTRERLRRRRSELADVLDQVNEWITSGSLSP